MLRITIELIPNGNERKKSVLSQVEITNTLEKELYGDYKYQYEGWWIDIDGERREIYKNYVSFDRNKPLYNLIYKVVLKILKPFTTY